MKTPAEINEIIKAERPDIKIGETIYIDISHIDWE